MQNTIEKGMKIHPVGTLIAVLACMFIFYVCNLIVMKFSKGPEEDLTKEVKQRVEEVKQVGKVVVGSETGQQERVEEVKATEKDIDEARREKIRAKVNMEGKPVPVAVKA